MKNRISCLIVLLVACVLPASVARARPGNVPAGYVATPFGYFDPTCIKTVGKYDIASKVGILHDNGVLEHVSCNKSAFSRSGELIDLHGKIGINKERNADNVAGGSVVYGNWRNDYSFDSVNPVGELTADFVVPSPPINPLNQETGESAVIGFFPGLEADTSGAQILQPVLHWEHGQWAMQNWNCCIQGVAENDSPIPVSPGDIIHTVIQSPDMGKNPGNLNYDVSYIDVTASKGSTFRTIAQAPMNWVFGAVLETYSIGDCIQYPDYGMDNMVFSKISIKDMSGNNIEYPSSWPENKLLPLQYVAGYFGKNYQCNGDVKITDPEEGSSYRLNSPPLVRGVGKAGLSVVVTDDTGSFYCGVRAIQANGVWGCAAQAIKQGSRTLEATESDNQQHGSEFYVNFTMK